MTQTNAHILARLFLVVKRIVNGAAATPKTTADPKEAIIYPL